MEQREVPFSRLWVLSTKVGFFLGLAIAFVSLVGGAFGDLGVARGCFGMAGGLVLSIVSAGSLVVMALANDAAAEKSEPVIVQAAPLDRPSREKGPHDPA